MKNVVIMCAAGMSSSLMAKKVTNELENRGYNIHVTSTIAEIGQKLIKDKKYDLYLISPQAKMHFKRLKTLANDVNRPLALIPIEAYAPIPKGVENLANLIVEYI